MMLIVAMKMMVVKQERVADALDLSLESLMQQQILRSQTMPPKGARSPQTPLPLAEVPLTPAPPFKRHQ
jgi:hypothetical protein